MTSPGSSSVIGDQFGRLEARHHLLTWLEENDAGLLQERVAHSWKPLSNKRYFSPRQRLKLLAYLWEEEVGMLNALIAAGNLEEIYFEVSWHWKQTCGRPVSSDEFTDEQFTKISRKAEAYDWLRGTWGKR